MVKYEYWTHDPNNRGRGAGYYYHRGMGEYSKAEAMSRAAMHGNRLGEGARARSNLTPEEKRRLVLHEFREGKLHSGSGGLVTDRGQAVAIALSEERRQRAERKGRYWG